MAPPAADVDLASHPQVDEYKVAAKSKATSRLTEPLKSSEGLDQYEHFDVTPVIGEEFPKLQLSEILSDDEKIKDLAVLGS